MRQSGAKIRFLEVEEDQHLHVESAHNHIPVVAKKKILIKNCQDIHVEKIS